MSDLVKHLHAGAADGAHPLTLLSEAADEIDALRATVADLKREIEVLRLYGNKDCTRMSDAALAQPDGGK